MNVLICPKKYICVCMCVCMKEKIRKTSKSTLRKRSLYRRHSREREYFSPCFLCTINSCQTTRPFFRGSGPRWSFQNDSGERTGRCKKMISKRKGIFQADHVSGSTIFRSIVRESHLTTLLRAIRYARSRRISAHGTNLAWLDPE